MEAGEKGRVRSERPIGTARPGRRRERERGVPDRSRSEEPAHGQTLRHEMVPSPLPREIYPRLVLSLLVDEHFTHFVRLLSFATERSQLGQVPKIFVRHGGSTCPNAGQLLL